MVAISTRRKEKQYHMMAISIKKGEEEDRTVVISIGEGLHAHYDCEYRWHRCESTIRSRDL